MPRATMKSTNGSMAADSRDASDTDGILRGVARSVRVSTLERAMSWLLPMEGLQQTHDGLQTAVVEDVQGVGGAQHNWQLVGEGG